MENQPTHLHHYTSIETLALILQSGKIRFNRLDKVNDIMESEKYGDYHLSKLLFVSCWTESNVESIPLWNMYSKMKGVKITLPIDLFHFEVIKPVIIDDLHIESEINSFLPIEEFYTKDYIIDPTKINCRRIIYVTDEKLREIKSKAITIQDETKDKITFKTKKASELAGYKTERWSFENEVRYVIMVYPKPPKHSGTIWLNELQSFLFNQMKSGINLDLSHIDVKINPEHLDNITVTMGPHIDSGSRIIVEELLHRFAKNARLIDSELRNLLRSQ